MKQTLIECNFSPVLASGGQQASSCSMRNCLPPIHRKIGRIRLGGNLAFVNETSSLSIFSVITPGPGIACKGVQNLLQLKDNPPTPDGSLPYSQAAIVSATKEACHITTIFHFAFQVEIRLLAFLVPVEPAVETLAGDLQVLV